MHLKLKFLEISFCAVQQKSSMSCSRRLAFVSLSRSMFSGELLTANKELTFSEYLFRENMSNLHVQIVTLTSFSVNWQIHKLFIK